MKEKLIPSERKGAPIEKFLAVARALNGDVIVTPEIFAELVAMAARLEEIEKIGK